MSVPTHGRDCKTVKYWHTKCPDCKRAVIYWECTCGSKVFFQPTTNPSDKLRKHECEAQSPEFLRAMQRSGVCKACHRVMTYKRFLKHFDTVPHHLSDDEIENKDLLWSGFTPDKEIKSPAKPKPSPTFLKPPSKLTKVNPPNNKPATPLPKSTTPALPLEQKQSANKPQSPKQNTADDDLRKLFIEAYKQSRKRPDNWVSLADIGTFMSKSPIYRERKKGKLRLLVEKFGAEIRPDENGLPIIKIKM